MTLSHLGVQQLPYLKAAAYRQRRIQGTLAMDCLPLVQPSQGHQVRPGPMTQTFWEARDTMNPSSIPLLVLGLPLAVGFCNE